MGLNLISLPLKDTGLNNASQLLGDICSGNADAIWKYDCNSGSFESFTIFDPGNGFDIPAGTPIWVNIPSLSLGCYWIIDGKIPGSIQYQLCSGLNMISIPVYSLSLLKASDLLESVPACNGVYRWTKEIDCFKDGTFDLYSLLSSPDEDFSLIPGRTYWVMISAPGLWIAN
ncbi:MAG: hypothetical protein A2161_18620 [Candidatus Schekmanbacteria bacterium RBG_13_48_7]|uniref:Uncharacterized protein n=1 Tax=Candidatus Schekmanbacteria bacterium RBG_13_48_7 TaxID=1817878 RepID=A0A1F7RJY3_9BACT|nr:MAG: hypothetical protein A2161_18620 [Candidatus Schekmanbacteria bacterium RBG_13_48_7]